jgi:hypothetical protein
MESPLTLFKNKIPHSNTAALLMAFPEFKKSLFKFPDQAL